MSARILSADQARSIAQYRRDILSDECEGYKEKMHKRIEKQIGKGKMDARIRIRSCKEELSEYFSALGYLVNFEPHEHAHSEDSDGYFHVEFDI